MIFDEYNDYRQKVDLALAVELEPYGLIADGESGRFVGRKREQELVEFCKRHPEFHMTSTFGDIEYNYYIPGARTYWLSKSPPDPTLSYTFGRLSMDDLKFAMDEALKIPYEKRTVGEHFGIRMVQAMLGTPKGEQVKMSEVVQEHEVSHGPITKMMTQ